MAVFAVPITSWLYQGAAAASGNIFVYKSGTTTLVTLYADDGLTTPVQNPRQLDSNGQTVFFVSTQTLLRFDVYNSSGTLIRSIDPVYPVATSTVSGATGFRNALINGNMAIAQRGVSFTGISGTTPTQTLDGWFGWTAGTANATINLQNSASVVASDGVNFAAVMRVQRPNGNTSVFKHNVAQVIPSADVSRLAGQACVLSFYARAGATFSPASGELEAQVYTGTTADEGSAAFTSGWTGSLLALDRFQAINTTLTRYSYPVTIGSNATEVAVQFGFTPSGTAGANDYFDVTGVQLELASMTGFEFLPFKVNLQRCLPFFRKSFPYATKPAQNAGLLGTVTVISQASSSFGGSFELGTSMFQNPSITTFNPSATNANWRDTTNGADRSVTVDNMGNERIGLYGASGVANATNKIHYTAEAGI